MSLSSGSSLLYMKIIIFSFVTISFILSIINLVLGVRKHIQELCKTKRTFFALNCNIILFGVFGTLVFGIVYMLATVFIDKFTDENNHKNLKIRILTPIRLSFQLSTAISILILAFARYILVVKSVEFHRFITSKKILLCGLQ